MTQDKKISEAAELLMKGAKMLSLHCPDCMFPLFQRGERIFCPSCKKEFEIIENENEKILKIKEETKNPETENIQQKTTETNQNEAENVIAKKIERLLDRLLDKAAETNNFHELKELIYLIKYLSEAYSSLRK